MKEPRSVIVKTLVVNKKPERVINFFSNVKNWETGGALKNVRKVDAKSWEADTSLGKTRIRLRHNKQEGILDHDFMVGRGGGGSSGGWTVFCRVTPNESGSTTSWLFICPEGMSQEQFESQLNNDFEKEMEGWKKALEALP
jgi:hypothetical protein